MQNVSPTGGEERVAEILDKGSRKELQDQLLEGDEEKGLSPHSTFHNFICQPSILGKDLYVIERFGLVQYVSSETISTLLVLSAFEFLIPHSSSAYR